jgi:hypothetical protein
MRGALGQHHALGLRVAGLASAATRTAEGLGHVDLVGQLDAAAVDGHQPQPLVERLGLTNRVGHRQAARADQIAQRR